MQGPWQARFWLENSAGNTFHCKLTSQLTKDIQTGRLAPGTMMPGSRSLAAQLNVNRKTIQLAYEELESQGWLISRPRKGTFVADTLPELSLSEENKKLINAKKTKSSSKLLGDLYSAALGSSSHTLAINDGIPDARLIPYEALSKAYRRALIQSSRQSYLGYGDPRGTIELRESIQNMLTLERYMNVSLDQVCIVRGSQMGIFLAARILDPTKGAVIFEEYCYSPAVAAFEANGFEIIRCELDQSGLNTQHLKTILKQHRVAGIYTTPHHQYPTTVCMSMERRLQLLHLSKQYNFAILEDDYDHEFHYDSRPVPPLFSLPNSENVIHIGSMSKVFAPGLRLGYLVAGQPFIDRAAQEIVLIDRQGNTVTELAVSDLMRSSEVKKHIRKVRKLYHARRDFAAIEFHRVFGDLISFTLPAGGMALWIDISKIVKGKNLKSINGPNTNLDNLFKLDRSNKTHIRFGFGALTEKEITTSVESLHSALVSQKTS